MMGELSSVFEKHILIKSSQQTAIAMLSEYCPELSKQKLKQAMQFGAVWLTHSAKTTRLRRAKKQLEVGDELHLYFDQAILFADIKPAILIADEIEYSVWNKPCGMFSQGTKWGDHSAICRWVELNGLELNGLAQRPAFLVHRLDRATSGLIMVAHTKKMAARLSALFESRQIEKHYKAIVSGKFSAIAENDRIRTNLEGKSASTQLLKIEYDPEKDQSQLLLRLETGRKHQIRLHLSSIGFPILGDRLYGERLSGDSFEQPGNQPDLQLQSCFLGFYSPVNDQYRRYSLN